MKLNKDQENAVTHIFDTGETYLVGQMGSGKTAVALTAAAELLKEGEVSRVLVVAPLKVCQDVWPVEARKWGDYFVTVCTGTVKQRLNVVSGEDKIICVNFENLAWMMKQDHKCDMLIVDEVTKLKAGGVGFKALRRVLGQFTTRLVMTGTPVSENFEQLFYCVMAADAGNTFGRNRKKFMREYFWEIDEWTWDLKADSADRIVERLNGLMVVLPDYVDELPELEEEIFEIEMGAEAVEYYKQLERDSINEHVLAENAAVLVGKLSQVASGFVYTSDGEAVPIHNAKLDAVQALIDGPTVIVYQYREELDRLEDLFGDDCTSHIELFKRGVVDILLMHPKSAGHGIDLTVSCNMIIYGPVWSSDLTRQTIARIWRRGQTRRCTVWTLVSEGTIDESIVDRERGKQTYHDMLMARLLPLGKASGKAGTPSQR